MSPRSRLDPRTGLTSNLRCQRADGASHCNHHWARRAGGPRIRALGGKAGGRDGGPCAVEVHWPSAGIEVPSRWDGYRNLCAPGWSRRPKTRLGQACTDARGSSPRRGWTSIRCRRGGAGRGGAGRGGAGRGGAGRGGAGRGMGGVSPRGTVRDRAGPPPAQCGAARRSAPRSGRASVLTASVWDRLSTCGATLLNRSSFTRLGPKIDLWSCRLSDCLIYAVCRRNQERLPGNPSMPRCSERGVGGARVIPHGLGGACQSALERASVVEGHAEFQRFM